MTRKTTQETLRDVSHTIGPMFGQINLSRETSRLKFSTINDWIDRLQLAQDQLISLLPRQQQRGRK